MSSNRLHLRICISIFLFVAFQHSMNIDLSFNSGYFYSASSSPLLLRRSRHGMDTMSEFYAEAPQTTASEALAPGPYVAATAGFEPTTLRSTGIDSTNEPHTPPLRQLIPCCLMNCLHMLAFKAGLSPCSLLLSWLHSPRGFVHWFIVIKALYAFLEVCRVFVWPVPRLHQSFLKTKSLTFLCRP